MKLFKPSDFKQALDVNVNFVGTRREIGFIRPAIAARTAGAAHQYDAFNAMKLAVDVYLERFAGIEMREACSIATEIVYGHLAAIILDEHKKPFMVQIGRDFTAIAESRDGNPPAFSELPEIVRNKIQSNGFFSVFDVSRIIEDAKNKINVTDADILDSSALGNVPGLIQDIQNSNLKDEGDPVAVLRDMFATLQHIERAEIEQNMAAMK